MDKYTFLLPKRILKKRKYAYAQTIQDLIE